MKVNRKVLLALVALVVLSIFAGVLVAAQAPQPVPDTEEDGEEESLASPSQAALTQDEAVAIAEEYAGSTAASVELEHEGGAVVYSVELEDGSEVEVDGNTGDILEVEGAGGDDD
jgi:uncharacterized membrane protein YkoI